MNSFLKDSVIVREKILDWAVFEMYPELKKYFDENRIKDINKIKIFIKLKYLEKNELIKQNLDIYRNNWKKIERGFFELTDDIVGNEYWPKGKYVAYPSIWGMFPRFLNDKTFQIPYNCQTEKYVNVIIAHEMLHFIFFEYFFRNYPKYKNDKFDALVWNVSEIFNVVVQNSPRWICLFELPSVSYPMHDEVIERISRIYYGEKNLNADRLIESILEEATKLK